jgi:hypothetical protein
MDKLSTNTFCPAIRLVFASVMILAFTSEPTQAAGICGTGTWISGNLEIHHINIGQGDSTLIVGPTGKSLLFDAGETNWNSRGKAQIIGPLYRKCIDNLLINIFHFASRLAKQY